MSESATTEKIAIVLAADLASGHAANVAACVAAGLAGARPGWAGAPLQDAAGLESFASCTSPSPCCAPHPPPWPPWSSN